MSKQSLTVSHGARSEAPQNPALSENLNYPQRVDQIRQRIAFAQVMIVTSLPRGTLQIAQPQELPEQILRAYARDMHRFDRLTWGSIRKGTAARGADCWEEGKFQSSKYFAELMGPNQFRFALAAPLKAPVFDGYPGAIHLYRTAEQGEFTDQDVAELNEIAAQLNEDIEQTRARRKTTPMVESEKLKRRVNLRTFIFNDRLQPELVGADPKELDERLGQQMLQTARQRIEHLNGQATVSDRVPLPDSNGDLWQFRVVTHKEYPALGSGAFVFFCQQPAITDWSALRSSDFQADNELARLIPAIRFMEAEFHRGPTLGEIAKQVHLSPFHFHRRFTELLGITPKHFLLDCQIDQAKKQLLSRETELSEIAAACGFAHQSHFTSRFKQATGLTPTRWRRFAIDAMKASNN